MAEELTPKENEDVSKPVYVEGVSFAAQVDAVLSGADTNSTHLKVMNTPLLLRQVGAENLPILITARHLKTIVQESGTEKTNYHGLGADLIKQLPELLSDPVMIMDSLTRDDSVVVVTNATDLEKCPVIAAIKLDGYGSLNSDYVAANIITSVYGKENFNSFISRNVNADTILYISKEKSQELIDVPGIQFPDKINKIDSNTIIRKARAFVNRENIKAEEEKNQESASNPGVQFPDINSAPDTTIIRKAKAFVNGKMKKSGENLQMNETKREDSTSIINKERAELVRDIVERMKNGDLVWRHFASLAKPHNGEDNRPYRGANVFRLWFAMYVNKWEDPRFFTFNQLGKAGYRIKKGEHASHVELWSTYDKEEKKYYSTESQLKKHLVEDKGMTEEEAKQYIDKNAYLRGRTYRVFNGEQLDGIEKWQGIKADESERNERCQEVITYAPVTIKQDVETQAFYSPSTDEVHLPRQFDNYEAFYATAFHEIAHSTGHKSRLNRDMSGEFGSPKYAREELVAELSSVFVQSDRGVALNAAGLDNHAAYLQSWLGACVDKPGDFFSAVKDAEKASNYINGAVKENMEKSTDARNKAIANYYKNRRATARENLKYNVPDEMKKLNNWCVFRTYRNAETGKREKRNLSVHDGKWASVSDPSTWCSFEEAIKYAEQNDCEGVTFVLTKEAGIHCIDLDECAGKRGGKREPMSEEATQFVRQAKGAYMEASASETGAHIFFKGEMPNLKHTVGKDDEKGQLEFYSDRKFISMTGNIERFNFDKVTEIATFDKGSELAAHLAARLGERAAIQTTASANSGSQNLSDKQVLERAVTSIGLWRGKIFVATTAVQTSD